MERSHNTAYRLCVQLRHGIPHNHRANNTQSTHILYARIHRTIHLELKINVNSFIPCTANYFLRCQWNTKYVSVCLSLCFSFQNCKKKRGKKFEERHLYICGICVESVFLGVCVSFWFLQISVCPLVICGTLTIVYPWICTFFRRKFDRIQF